ncbi:Oxidoreductase NAD-binding domain-containing protein 1 [Sporothrix curviconia]|uniref:Oxidoreductase NAD-binding domain-containing protein 1 n=1 Tax=Sporothrix curviconia TaxID=1260050 RepID=A0ABP0CBW0_9PEZI
MPCFRGVELSIVAASDHSVFPEFPHPDGSSVRLGGLQSSRYSGAVFLSPRRLKKTDGNLSDDAQRHADPKISVYIPSAPDTNFYLRYVIEQAPIGHKYLFFRVAINGRQVVSWGVDMSETLMGEAHQALFEPSAYYQYSDNGVVMTQYGIESRCFRFVAYGSGGTSIAHDGGLIEVQVFRAKSRARRAPQPDPYRGGDKYGVALISNGLLENPQMANYYVYHLIDPKDAPYASFRFHYRSWENLRLLQLAPSEKPDFLCASPAKAPPADGCKQNGGVEFDFSSLTDRLSISHHDGLDALQPSAPRKERPLPALPINRKTPASSERVLSETCDEYEAAGTENENGTAVISGDNLCIQRARGISEASKCSMASNISIAKSLQEYADGKDGLLVDTMELGSAIKLETVFQGKALEKLSSAADRDECFAISSDDVFASAKNSPDPEEDDTLSANPSAESSVKKQAKPRRIYVAPFTDSLCKREVASLPRSPTRRHVRGVSHGSSPKSDARSGKHRRHGGSLDSW